MSSLRMYGEKPKRMYTGGLKVKKAYCMGEKVWSAGNIVTYICNGVSYQEEVEDGNTVLSPTTFTPTLSGSVFLGWSLSADSPIVQTSLVMEDNPITLYAVWATPFHVDLANAGWTFSKTNGEGWFNQVIGTYVLVQSKKTLGNYAYGRLTASIPTKNCNRVKVSYEFYTGGGGCASIGIGGNTYSLPGSSAWSGTIDCAISGSSCTIWEQSEACDAQLTEIRITDIYFYHV